MTDMEPTPEAIAEAKRNPGGWVYVIDGAYGPDEAIPPERIRGTWRVDEAGHITGEFIPNPYFMPIPSASDSP
jgi:hypothetical protein